MVSREFECKQCGHGKYPCRISASGLSVDKPALCPYDGIKVFWAEVNRPLRAAERRKTERAANGAGHAQQAKVKIPRCPYDGLCDVSTKINGVIYCDRANGVCNG